jgi:predicted DNA-binding protein (MmcQ/YjbR family)
VTYDELLELCLSLPGAWQDDPWGDHVVAKVGGPPGRIFAFPGDVPPAVSLKLPPDDAVELRAACPAAVGDAPYLSRRHWVRVALDGTLPDDELADLVRTSHALVVSRLPRGRRPA